MGLPPVVLGGNQLRFNQGAAILRELDLPELISKSRETYTELAIRLGEDEGWRNDLRARIQSSIQQRPLFLDPRGFADRVGRVFKSLANQIPGHWKQAV